jgi:hypothetical protein
MVEGIGWTTGLKVRVVDRKSPYFGKMGVLKTAKQFPVLGKMPYHYWSVEIDHESVLFAQGQLARME